MSDIVERLRKWDTFWEDDLLVAADEIERLRAELAVAKQRVAELEYPIRNPLSRALELEQALAAMRNGGGE